MSPQPHTVIALFSSIFSDPIHLPSPLVSRPSFTRWVPQSHTFGWSVLGWSISAEVKVGSKSQCQLVPYWQYKSSYYLHRPRPSGTRQYLVGTHHWQPLGPSLHQGKCLPISTGRLCKQLLLTQQMKTCLLTFTGWSQHPFSLWNSTILPKWIWWIS